MGDVEQLKQDTAQLKQDTAQLRKEFAQSVVDRDSNVAIHELVTTFLSVAALLLTKQAIPPGKNLNAWKLTDSATESLSQHSRIEVLK